MPKGHFWLRNSKRFKTSKIIVEKINALFLVFRWHCVEGEMNFWNKNNKVTEYVSVADKCCPICFVTS